MWFVNKMLVKQFKMKQKNKQVDFLASYQDIRC